MPAMAHEPNYCETCCRVNTGESKGWATGKERATLEGSRSCSEKVVTHPTNTIANADEFPMNPWQTSENPLPRTRVNRPKRYSPTAAITTHLSREEDPGIEFLGEGFGREVPAVDPVARAVGEDPLFPACRSAARSPLGGGLDQDQPVGYPPGLGQEAVPVLQREQAVEEGGEDPAEGAVREWHRRARTRPTARAGALSPASPRSGRAPSLLPRGGASETRSRRPRRAPSLAATARLLG